MWCCIKGKQGRNVPFKAKACTLLDKNLILNFFFPQCIITLNLEGLNNCYLYSFLSVSGGKDIQRGAKIYVETELEKLKMFSLHSGFYNQNLCSLFQSIKLRSLSAQLSGRNFGSHSWSFEMHQRLPKRAGEVVQLETVGSCQWGSTTGQDEPRGQLLLTWEVNLGLRLFEGSPGLLSQHIQPSLPLK